MTFLKNAKDQTQHPQNIAAMAISIAATTFMPHPLLSCAGKELTNWQEKELLNFQHVKETNLNLILM